MRPSELPSTARRSQSGVLGDQLLGNYYLPMEYFYVIVMAVILLFSMVSYQHNRLPRPLMRSDVTSHEEQFIAEFAHFHLEQLTSFGPKVFGSYANQVLAVEFLKREILYIMAQAAPVNEIKYNVQEPKGCYHLDFIPYSFVNCYDTVKNIIVKLSSNTSSQNALLVNCHYDSVPESPGSSDDGLNCMVMLEIIRVLSKSSQPLRHSIVFLFNGAEETPLQASHGFITQHPWARDVKAFINLEACGAGGKEVLFQTGPGHPWLLDHYVKSVPHPHGLVVAEEIFQSGLVPSDTDFRIFRDFGYVPGLDFAHASNGYVYHTKYDNLDYIPMGSLQHTGDNILALIKKIVSSDELDDTEKSPQVRMVYFDILGLIMISYSEEMGWVINTMVVFISFYAQQNLLNTIGRGYPRRQIIMLHVRSILYTLYGWMSGVVTMVVTAFFLDIFQVSMSWYSTPALVFPLYFVPMIFASMSFYLSHGRGLMAALKPVEKAQVYVNGVKSFFCGLLLFGTLLKIRSSFVVMLLVTSHTLMDLVLIIGKKQLSFYPWIMAHLLGATFGLIFLMYLTILSYSLFIPITGRMGSIRNPEFFIGALSSMLCILSTSFYTPLIVLLKYSRTILYQLGSVFLLILVTVVCTRLSFPYNGDPAAPTPQRIMIHHTRQRFHELGGRPYYDDSGFWIIHLDRHNPGSLKNILPDMAMAKSVEPLCEKTVYCGLPLLSPRLLPLCNYTYWIAAEEPILHFATSVQLLKREWLAKDLLEMTFVVTGPDRLEVYISPNIDVTVANWNFTSPLPSGKPLWNNRSTYFIHYSSGNVRSKMTFTLNLQVPYYQVNILDIGVVGHYINSHKNSKHFEAFLRKYPNWTHVTPMTSMYASWKF